MTIERTHNPERDGLSEFRKSWDASRKRERERERERAVASDEENPAGGRR
jgi:hypothetical protein